MPAVVSHFYFGERMIERFEDESITKHRDAFNLGLQGPDPLFFLHFNKKYNKTGTLIHDTKIKELFVAMSDYIKRTGDEIAKAYFLGFLCHYALDKHSHPYVEYKLITHPMYVPMSKIPRHFLLESGMDYMVVKDKYGQDPAEFRKDVLVASDKKTWRAIAAMMTQTVLPVFGAEMSMSTSVKTYSRMFKVFKFLYDPKKKKNRFFSALEKFFRIPPYITTFSTPVAESPEQDWCNKEHKAYGDDGKSLDFYEIIDEAIVSADALLAAAVKSLSGGIDIPDELFDRDYGGECLVCKST